MEKHSFSFQKEDARKFIVACKKLELSPEKELAKCMEETIKRAKEKDNQLFIKSQEPVFKQRELTFAENNEYVDAIRKASNNRLSASQAIELSKYFYKYAKAVYNDKKQLQSNGVQRMAEWIWYEYSTNPFKYPLVEWGTKRDGKI